MSQQPGLTRRRERVRLPAAQRRLQILDATTGLVAERGFWGLSMQDVADHCALTVPGLLHHVGTKDGLLLALLEHRDARDAEALTTQLGLTTRDLMEGDWVERVSLPEFCAATVRRNDAQPKIVQLFAVLQAESIESVHPAHGYFATRERRSVATVSRLMGHRVPDSERLARAVLALMDGVQLQWLRDPGRSSLVERWQAASADILRPWLGEE